MKKQMLFTSIKVGLFWPLYPIAEILVWSIYTLTPNKLLQKVFQWILVVIDIISNTLKIPQNPTSGKLLFSKLRPRWPP